MYKKVIQFLIVLLGFCLCVSASENINIFIDISGSMDSNLNNVKNYLTNEYLPSLPNTSEIRIFKFYGKLRTPPIFEGTLDRKDKKLIGQITKLMPCWQTVLGQIFQKYLLL